MFELSVDTKEALRNDVKLEIVVIKGED